MNVFLVPAAAPTARANFEETMRRRVAPDRLVGLSTKSVSRAKAAVGGVRAWGTQPADSNLNVATWEAMEPGDWVLFYSEGRFPAAGRVLLREHSPEVARALWGADAAGQTWEYLYLMDEVRWIEAPRLVVLKALTYERSGFYPRKFIRVNRSIDPRYEDVEEMLNDLTAVGEALTQAVSAAGSGDRAAAAVAVDPLVDRMSRAALAEAIRSHTTSAPPAVQKRVVEELDRDRRLVVKLKDLYEGRCQCCGFTFEKDNGEPYSEVAHLRAISKREANLDVKDNLVVLCANHHRMLDFGPIEIKYDAAADELLLHEDGRATVLVNEHIGPGRPRGRLP
jgi:hypothetical protein